MKYKKYTYIIVLILMLIVGIDRTYAAKKDEGKSKTCYYISSDDNLKISLRIGYGFETNNPNKIADKLAVATIWQIAPDETPLKHNSVNNWYTGVSEVPGHRMPEWYKDAKTANNDPNPSCPRILIYLQEPQFFDLIIDHYVFATNSESEAQTFINAAQNEEFEYYKYASNYKYKNGKQTQITEDMFFGDFITSGLIEYDPKKKEYTCTEEEKTELFGNPNDDGDKFDPNGDEAASIRYLMNQILGTVRIIVPILIILLGTIDFAKAVLAGKEDNMKKAQSTFIKRLIAGLAVFLIPTFINIIMGLADIVWAGDYTYCDFM